MHKNPTSSILKFYFRSQFPQRKSLLKYDILEGFFIIAPYRYYARSAVIKRKNSDRVTSF